MANNCNNTLVNLQRVCEDKNNKGGLYTEIMVAYHKDVQITMDRANNQVTNIEMATGGDAKWYCFQFAKGSAELTSEYTFDGDTGDKQFCTNTLTIDFKKQSQAKKISLIGLLNSEVFILIKDANGAFYALGTEEYASANSATSTTGKARTDANQYTIAVSDTTQEFAPDVKADVAQDIFDSFVWE